MKVSLQVLALTHGYPLAAALAQNHGMEW